MLRWTPRDLASEQSPVLYPVWFLLMSRVGRGRRGNKAQEPANKKMVWEGLACTLSCCVPLANEGLSDALGVWKLYCVSSGKSSVLWITLSEDCGIMLLKTPKAILAWLLSLKDFYLNIDIEGGKYGPEESRLICMLGKGLSRILQSVSDTSTPQTRSLQSEIWAGILLVASCPPLPVAVWDLGFIRNERWQNIPK